MKTDDLIRAMAGDTVVAASPKQRLIWLVPALVVAIVGLWTQLGFRADLALALQDPVSSLRIVFTLSLGAAGLWAVNRLARPGAAVPVWPLWAIGLMAVAVWLWAYAAMPAEGRQMAIVGKTMVGCLTTIPMLAVLPTLVVLLALRQGAVTRPVLAGGVAGLAGGGLAAAVYALHCTEDSPLFYVTWYGTAILGVAAVAAFIAPRVLRW